MKKTHLYRTIAIGTVVMVMVCLQTATAQAQQRPARRQMSFRSAPPAHAHATSPAQTRGPKKGKPNQRQVIPQHLQPLAQRIKALSDLAHEAHRNNLCDIAQDLRAKAHHAELILKRERELHQLRISIEQMQQKHAELLQKAKHFEREYANVAIMANDMAKNIEKTHQQINIRAAAASPTPGPAPCPKCSGPCNCNMRKYNVPRRTRSPLSTSKY
jgi:hypothetical protein